MLRATSHDCNLEERHTDVSVCEQKGEKTTTRWSFNVARQSDEAQRKRVILPPPSLPTPCCSPCHGDDHNEDEAASWAD